MKRRIWVSIHAPARGATGQRDTLRRCAGHKAFLSRAPARGALWPVYCALSHALALFLSTLPRGRRSRSAVCIGADLRHLHAPRGERLRMLAARQFGHQCFYPRSTRGERLRPSSALRPLGAYYFYPRSRARAASHSRCGWRFSGAFLSTTLRAGDAAVRLMVPVTAMAVFLSTLPRGERPPDHRSTSATSITRFLSTLPRGERPAAKAHPIPRGMQLVSIHAPRAGSDVQLSTKASRRRECFLSTLPRGERQPGHARRGS